MALKMTGDKLKIFFFYSARDFLSLFKGFYL